MKSDEMRCYGSVLVVNSDCNVAMLLQYTLENESDVLKRQNLRKLRNLGNANVGINHAK